MSKKLKVTLAVIVAASLLTASLGGVVVAAGPAAPGDYCPYGKSFGRKIGYVDSAGGVRALVSTGRALLQRYASFWDLPLKSFRRFGLMARAW